MIERPSKAGLVAEMKTVAIFSDLDEATLAELADRAVWRRYDKGEIVVREGQASAGLYYLESGWLKVIKTSPNGREQILRFLEPGETFNEVGVFTDAPNPATAVVLSPAGVWWLPRQTLTDLLRSRPEFAEMVIAKMARYLTDLVTLVSSISLQTVSARLAGLILDDADGDVLSRPRWFTQGELAGRLGTVTDVVQRALRDLEAQGLIEVERDRIVIRDRPALETLTE